MFRRSGAIFLESNLHRRKQHNDAAACLGGFGAAHGEGGSIRVDSTYVQPCASSKVLLLLTSAMYR